MNGVTNDRPVVVARADPLPPLDPAYFDIGKIVIGPIRFSDGSGSTWIFSRCGEGIADARCVDGVTRRGGILSLGLGQPAPPPAASAQWRGMVFDQTVDQRRLDQLLNDPSIRPQRLAYTKAVAPPLTVNVVLPPHPT